MCEVISQISVVYWYLYRCCINLVLRYNFMILLDCRDDDLGLILALQNKLDFLQTFIIS